MKHLLAWGSKASLAVGVWGFRVCNLAVLWPQFDILRKYALTSKTIRFGWSWTLRVGEKHLRVLHRRTVGETTFPG